MGLFKSKAERWFEEGDNLIYRQGKIEEGTALLEQAAEREFAPAMMRLAEMYHAGRVCDGSECIVAPCTKNEARALELYQKLPDCLPVLARKAEIFFYGDGVPRDDAKALQLFREIQSRANEKENRKLFSLLGIMRFWRDDISAKALACDAEVYIAVMRFWGRGGLEEDLEQEYDVLDRYVRSHEKTNGLNGDFYFCHAALGYRLQGQGFLMSMERLDRLTKRVYLQTANPEIKRILKEEMLIPSLKKMFEESIRADRLYRAKNCVSLMTLVCRKDTALHEQLDEFLLKLLKEETDRLSTSENYTMLIGLLEQCSADFDSIRISCHLISYYMTHNITRTRTIDGVEQEPEIVRFDDDAHTVISRLCGQMERLQESDIGLKDKFSLAHDVKWMLYRFDIRLKELSPDDFNKLYQQSDSISGEWQDSLRMKQAGQTE
ncbi:MAG: sel1 repeat family protein [Eubacterium sp.]|nr:sel1 repeat family protein [Eubacterium sp.]